MDIGEMKKTLKKIEVDYDYKNDILYLYTGKKAKDSLQIEKFVIDFSRRNKVSGVEVLDASKILSEIAEAKINKKDLKDIKKASIKIVQGKEIMYVILSLMFAKNKKVRAPVPAPLAIKR